MPTTNSSGRSAPAGKISVLGAGETFQADPVVYKESTNDSMPYPGYCLCNHRRGIEVICNQNSRVYNGKDIPSGL